MKKLFVFFLGLTLITACSNDDDVTTPEEDPILGTWILVDASAPLDDQFCFDEESTITFNENNTMQAIFFLAASDCSANTSEGTWSNTGSSEYTMTVPVAGSLQGTANFTSANRFTFTTTFFGIPGVLTFERQ